jgi:rhodanese-related sulfurtransferase
MMLAMSDVEQAATDLAPDRVAEMAAEGAELIDVRRPVEWEAGRIGGARNIEMNELTAAADSIDRERPVIFYCRSGNRSQMAAQAFREAGFDAYHVAGGIQAWANSGRPLDPEDGEVRAPPPPTA